MCDLPVVGHCMGAGEFAGTKPYLDLPHRIILLSVDMPSFDDGTFYSFCSLHYHCRLYIPRCRSLNIRMVALVLRYMTTVKLFDIAEDGQCQEKAQTLNGHTPMPSTSAGKWVIILQRKRSPHKNVLFLVSSAYYPFTEATVISQWTEACLLSQAIPILTVEPAPLTLENLLRWKSYTQKSNTSKHQILHLFRKMPSWFTTGDVGGSTIWRCRCNSQGLGWGQCFTG